MGTEHNDDWEELTTIRYEPLLNIKEDKRQEMKTMTNNGSYVEWSAATAPSEQDQPVANKDKDDIIEVIITTIVILLVIHSIAFILSLLFNTNKLGYFISITLFDIYYIYSVYKEGI